MWLICRLILATLLIFVAAISSAWAACVQGDLAGGWDAYAIGESGGSGYWQRCIVRFSADGRIRSISSCRTDQGQQSSLSGLLSIGNGCQFRGTVRTTTKAGTLRCSMQATLVRDHDSGSGVGRCEDGDVFLLTLVRR